MGFSSRSGHAVTNSRKPEAFGVCDRCGRWFNLYRLKWQYEWSGTQLINLRLLVCDVGNGCLDIPQPQLKARVVEADPIPVRDPRVQDFYDAGVDFLVTDPTLVGITDESGSPLIIE
jgi:hypothetical protein